MYVSAFIVAIYARIYLPPIYFVAVSAYQEEDIDLLLLVFFAASKRRGRICDATVRHCDWRGRI